MKNLISGEQIKLWDKFDDFMEEQGYRILVNNDTITGFGTVAFKDDTFAPMFNLHVWFGADPQNFISLHVVDRNGSKILHSDPTAAIYKMSNTGDEGQNAYIFMQMLSDALEKYGKYCKTNRLDFAFNDMHTERKVYDQTVLDKPAKSLDDQIKAAKTLATEVQPSPCMKGKEPEPEI